MKKPRKKISPEAREKHDLKLFLIRSFCPTPNYSRDMLLAGRAVAICNDKSVWEKIVASDCPKSLLYFLSPAGINFLKENMFEMPQKADYNLSQDKVGEDIEIVKKPQTLLEFLKN